MTPENFVYWLQDYAELVDKAPNEAQWQMIKDHITLTLTKVKPPFKFTPSDSGSTLPDFFHIPTQSISNQGSTYLPVLTC